MHGGLALCSVSRYSAKFLVLPMSFRMFSSTPIERAFTALHVLLSRWIGAVPSAEMIDVSVEKLLRTRHFYSPLAYNTYFEPGQTHICHIYEVLNDNHSSFHILLCQDHLRNPVCQLVGVKNERLNV
jgi:hypothetical protein